MTPHQIIAELQEYAPGMWRFRWWAAGVAWAIAIAGWLFVYTMPDVYQGAAKVFVDTNTLLRPLMEDLAVQDDTTDQARLMTLAVLTRPNLELVARRTDLDLRAATPDEMERLITGLQTGIRLTGGRDNIFTVQYEDPSRQKARDVVAAVLDTFVENALGREGNDADLTERAVAAEIEDHERRLAEAEVRLGQFKKDNIGYMPDEAGDYYARLQGAIGAVASKEQRLHQLTRRRDELQRQLDGEEPVFGIMPTPAGGGGGCSLDGQVAGLEAEIAALRLQFTDRYPRVEALQETLARLEQQCIEEQQGALAASPQFAAPAQPLEANPVYQSIKMQVSAADADMAQLRAELQADQSSVARLRSDVDKITDIETQLKQLNRDYAVIQGRHQELLGRWEELQAKKRMDPMTEQVQFRRIEPPFAPAEPSGPDRPLLLSGVLIFALGGAIAVAFGLNMVRPVFFTGQGLRKRTELPVLGSVTLILTPEAVARRRAAAFAWTAVCIVLIVATGVVARYSAPGSALLRGLMGGAGT